MRWILAFVLILNGLVYWWYQQNEGLREFGLGVRSQVNPLVNASTEPIVLLRERQPRPAAKPYEESAITVDSFEEKEQGSEGKDVEVGREAEKQERDELPSVCGMIGPFSDKISARQIQNRLATLDITGDLRKEEIEIEPVYWVFLPPRENRKQALAVLRELQSKNIDAFMIAEGDQKFGISLGFFKQKVSAEDFQKLRTQQGYPAELIKKNKKREMYWFALESSEMAKISESLFYKLKDDFPLLQKQQNLCSRVASLDYIE